MFTYETKKQIAGSCILDRVCRHAFFFTNTVEKFTRWKNLITDY